MAKNDELDNLLSDPRITQEEWNALGQLLEIDAILTMDPSERCQIVNQEIRHSYGHAVANVFRTAYEPDYVNPILIETAKKLHVAIFNHQADAIEDAIVIKVIEMAKVKIIKTKGAAAWEQIERAIEKDWDEWVQLGKIPHSASAELKKIRGAALMVALFEGRIAGFALYVIANQTLFAMARFLGIKIGAEVAAPMLNGVFSFLMGPAAIALAGLLLVYDLGDSNWEKVIAAVLMVATIRKRLIFAC